MVSSDDPATFAGTSYGSGPLPDRIVLPCTPPHLGERPPSTVEAWMWYFAGWEPEYTWDSWAILSENAPDRLPLLCDPTVVHGDQAYYRASHPDVLAWHVRWLREAGVSTMLFQFIAGHDDDGTFQGPSFSNRTLEVPFLGKDELGGPPGGPGPYADSIRFAVMWTNFDAGHGNYQLASAGLRDYMIENYLVQPHYARVDGKAVLPVFNLRLLAEVAGGTDGACTFLESFRKAARDAGVGELLIIGVNNAPDPDLISAVGADGQTAYQYFGTNGSERRERTVGGRVIADLHEDFEAQTIPGYRQRWDEIAPALRGRGLEYLLPVCPRQDWRPLDRDWQSRVFDGTTPDGCRRMLHEARDAIGRHGLRPIVVVEAWNEWGEGGVLEPSATEGFAWAAALRGGLAVPSY